MTQVEFKRLRAELLRIQSARAEMEYVIEQRMEEIKRIEENIKNQEAAEKKVLDQLEGGNK